jgi:hypothetical protein
MRGIEGGDEDGGVEKISPSKPPGIFAVAVGASFAKGFVRFFLGQGLAGGENPDAALLCIGEE